MKSNIIKEKNEDKIKLLNININKINIKKINGVKTSLYLSTNEALLFMTLCNLLCRKHSFAFN